MMRWSWLVFLLMLSLFVVALTPISFLNRWFIPQAELLNAHGDLSQGAWQGVKIKGKNYPLNCRYQRQSGLRYRLQCQSPVNIEATIQLRGLQTLAVSDSSLMGQLTDMQSWLHLFGLPKGLSGEVGLHIEKAVMTDNGLEHLQVSGSGQQLGWLNQELIPAINLSTLSAEQSPKQPITITLSTPPENNTSPKVYLETQLPDNHYQTSGEISGQGMGQYAAFLSLLGTQTQADTFVINWQGVWLQ